MPNEELIQQDIIVAGTPEYLVERFEHFRRELVLGHLLLQGHESQMDAPTTWRSIEDSARRLSPPSPKPQTSERGAKLDSVRWTRLTPGPPLGSAG